MADRPTRESVNQGTIDGNRGRFQFSDVVILAIIPVVAYVAVTLYQSGRNSYYGIPGQLGGTSDVLAVLDALAGIAGAIVSIFSDNFLIAFFRLGIYLLTSYLLSVFTLNNQY